MARYVINFFNADGGIHHSQVVDCASDDEAIEAAGRTNYLLPIDIHKGGRLVVRVPISRLARRGDCRPGH
ncbi:MAG TPA: hypothetical protein VG939_12470 [Caulobacteraceae bacterium]|nr:hypothetical protein [Caulobacteraceae bacterium]